MKWNKHNILEENERRNKEIAKEYDPIVGTEYCEEIKRFHIHIDRCPIVDQNIPVEMQGEPVVRVLMQTQDLYKAGAAIFGGAATKSKAVKVLRYYHKLRCKYDFEFWCAYQIVIRQKGEGKRDTFILNRAQRRYLQKLEKLRKAGKPIWVILLKARQWGGSTMTQFYMFWIQKMWKKDWNSVICGTIEKQSKVVLSMLENAANDYDTFIDNGEPTVLRPAGRTNNIREIVGRNCTITVLSAEKPENVRGEDIAMAHITEVGLWKSTISKTPEDIVQSIQGTLINGPYSLYVLESTAKGVGNFFHNTWLGADEDPRKRTNNLNRVFIPWFMIDLYRKEITNYELFIDSMDSYEWMLFDYGATLEAISWYRDKLLSMSGDRKRMKSEFPSTPDEAFQSTGSLYFPEEYVNELYEDCEEPLFRGEIVGNDVKGTEALENLRIDKLQDGKFSVWKDVDKTVDMANRYLVIVDLGRGHSTTADNSIITVFDRYWQIEPTGIPEVVAEWAGHLDMDLVAWKAAQIAHYYNNALLVIEDNSLIMSGVNHFMTVLAEIKDYYPNIWKREIANKTDPAGKARYGWRTDGESKPRILTNLLGCIRDRMYIERSKEAVHEMKIYEEKENGTYGNVEGKDNHDDRVITRAIGVTFMFDTRLMDAPYIYDRTNQEQTYSNTIVNDI